MKKPWYDYRAGGSLRGIFHYSVMLKQPKVVLMELPYPLLSCRWALPLGLTWEQHLDSFLCCNKLHTASLKGLESVLPSCQQPICLQIYIMIFSKVSQTGVLHLPARWIFIYSLLSVLLPFCLQKLSSSLKKLCLLQMKETSVTFSKAHHLYEGKK